MTASVLETVSTQLSSRGVPPALVTAFLALSFAILIAVINPQRPANRFWALALTFQALWEGAIGIAQAYGGHADILLPVLRLNTVAAFCLIWSMALLYEAIITPWASAITTLVRARWHTVLIPIGALALTSWFEPWTAAPGHPSIGPLHAPLLLGGLGVGGYYLARAGRQLQRRLHAPRARAEMRAYVIFGSACLLVAALNVTALRLGVPEVRWVSPVVFWVAYPCAALVFVREHRFIFRDIERTTTLALLRGLFYGGAACAIVVVVGFLARSEMRAGEALVWLLIAFGVALLPTADDGIQSLVARRFTSPSFLRAKAAADGLIRSGADVGGLHAGYCRILREWSGGSEEVFLSDGAFTPQWPAERLPPSLLQRLPENGAVTPESTQLLGSAGREDFEYLTRNRVGAVVCAAGDGGERLIAALEARSARGPFLPGELREARSLLATMQLGCTLARMRQRLRGNERLNLYAQYAPQFAHELRNGLYLQTQLLSAIANGRAGDVQPEDARFSLEQTGHIDRLCDYFFQLGTLFNRPIERVPLKDALGRFIDGFRGSADAPQAGPAIRVEFEAEEAIEVLANEELLRMALQNLVKNGIEAGEAQSCPMVEIVVTRELDKAHLLIQDHGQGLPEDRRADPFTPGRSHKRNGMGLGLSIVRDCVEAMGGTVGLRYSGSEGTGFEIALVCAKRFDGAAVPCSLITQSV